MVEDPGTIQPTPFALRPVPAGAPVQWDLEQLTHINRARQVLGPVIAQVTGPSVDSQHWKIHLYRDGPETVSGFGDDEDGVAYVVNAPANYPAPVNKWIVVYEHSDPMGGDKNKYYTVLQDADLGGLAIATTGIGAGSIAAPANATCALYNVDGTSQGTGTVYNMSNVIATGKEMQFKTIQGRRYVDVSKC